MTEKAGATLWGARFNVLIGRTNCCQQYICLQVYFGVEVSDRGSLPPTLLVPVPREKLKIPTLSMIEPSAAACKIDVELNDTIYWFWHIRVEKSFDRGSFKANTISS